MAQNNSSQYGLLSHDYQLRMEQPRGPATDRCDQEGPACGLRPLLQLFSAWYLPLLHLSYTILLTTGVIYWLNERLFSTSDMATSKTILSQTDVMTIFSACLVVGRIIAGAWQTLAAWRCVFILSEKTEISLSDVNRIVSWRLPSISMIRSKSSERSAIMTRYTAALVLVSIWPAQLMNPVASGSISWIPTTSYDDLKPTPDVGIAFPGVPWGWYNDYSTTRELLVKNSAGLASLARDIPSKDGTSPWTTYPAQRMVSQFSTYPDGTLVENATVPFFDITSFEWITETTQVPKGILDSVQAQNIGYLNISKPESPLGQVLVGTSALLKDHPWNKSSSKLAESLAVSETMFAALFVSREFNAGQGDKYKCQTERSVFGPFLAELINVPSWNNYSDCIAIAKLHVNAGVSHCRQTTTALSSPSDSLVYRYPGVLRAENNTVSPDPLVLEVFAMMPEVQSLGAALGFNNQTMFNESEQYLRRSLTHAYQGTWSALSEFFSDHDQRVTSRARRPYQLLQARVAIWRIYIWMAVNLLAALSGLLLFQMQSSCNRKTVTEPIIAALTINSYTRIAQR